MTKPVSQLRFSCHLLSLFWPTCFTIHLLSKSHIYYVRPISLLRLSLLIISLKCPTAILSPSRATPCGGEVLTWCYFERFSRETCTSGREKVRTVFKSCSGGQAKGGHARRGRKNGSGGEVPHGVTSGASRETSKA